VIWRNWNQADRTLLLALVVFVFALCLHLEYTGNIVAEACLFCAEAALVGGIADWFAVTALFRKPLGFPYHTALLPRRRQAFIHASVQLVQQEFFSRRKIFQHLERMHLLPLLLGWLGQAETEAQLRQRLTHYLRDALGQQSGAVADALAPRLRQALREVEPTAALGRLGRWLQTSGRDSELVAGLSQYLTPLVAREETRQSIEALFTRYGREYAQGGLAQLLSGLAEATGAVDYAEAAALSQKQLLALLAELGEVGSPQQQALLQTLYAQASALADDSEMQQLLCGLRDQLANALPLEHIIRETLGELRAQLSAGRQRAGQAAAAAPVDAEATAQSVTGTFALPPQVAAVLHREYQRTLALVQEDAELRRSVGHFLYDVIARSALHAQTLVGVIVTSVLERLTDEQLNRLVYDKVEPDLLWIRMNGSIVGALIGLLLFTALHLMQLY